MCSYNEIDFKNIIDSLEKEKSDLLLFAYNFTKEAHKGQKRKSGEDYFIHPLSVAISLWNKFKDIELTIAGFLHDTVEDCEGIEIGDIYEKFGKNVGFMVDSVTKGENTFYGETEIIEDIKDKMIAGGIKNIGCILLKLADREHNLATLNHMPANKQVRKSFESQSLYIPLMHILGFNESSCSNILKCSKLFQDYLFENNLKDYKIIKNKLLNICFKDFNEELFDIVYNNSTNVVWELEDKNFFNELIETGWLDSDGVEVISLEGDLGNYFKITFKIEKGHNFNNFKKIKLLNNTFTT